MEMQAPIGAESETRQRKVPQCQAAVLMQRHAEQLAAEAAAEALEQPDGAVVALVDFGEDAGADDGRSGGEDGDALADDPDDDSADDFSGEEGESDDGGPADDPGPQVYHGSAPYQPAPDYIAGPLDCDVCGGTAALNRSGALDAPRCAVSGGCEWSWTDMHPEQYRQPSAGEGTPGKLVAAALPCGGVGCKGVVWFADEHGQLPCPELAGECRVDREGANWWEHGRPALDRMTPTLPETGIERYDGEVVPIPPVDDDGSSSLSRFG